MPSGKKFTTEEARELQKASVIARKRNDRGQQPTRERKERAIELHASGLTVNEIKTKMGLSRRTVKRYLETTESEAEEGRDVGIGDLGHP